MTYQETTYQQVNVVDASGNIISSFGSGGTGGSKKTPDLFLKTDSGTIPAGYQSLAVCNTGSNAALVKGVTFPPGSAISWSVEGNNDTLDSVSYDATGTSLLFATLG